MLLSASFLTILAAVECAFAVSDEIRRGASAFSDPNTDLLWHTNADSGFKPQPVRGTRGASILANANDQVSKQSADTLAPPFTDNGLIKNLKFSMAQAVHGLFPGGFGQSFNKDDLPVATDMSMGGIRLRPGAARSLHWHDGVEWGYVLVGECRVTCFTPKGQIWTGDVPAGDVWNFPNAYPHSIQAKNVETEFLVAFDVGDYGRASGYLLTDWLAHTPAGVLLKNFGWQDSSILNNIPKTYLYLYQSVPPPEKITDDWTIPNNTPVPYTYQLSKAKPIKGPGGSVKIIDSTTFKGTTHISALEVTVDPGRLRELHLHPYITQYTMFLEGEARMTVFASGVGQARTFNFVAGDVGYVPSGNGHYIENTGNTTLKFLEITKSNEFEDVSAHQWMASVPKSLLKGEFNFTDDVIKGLKREKQWVV